MPRSAPNSVLGLIPARGGSKGVPRKNLRPIAGKPLIEWTIEAAKAATGLDRVIVSTDDEEIAAVATRLGAEVPFMRPAELARDDTPDLPVFLDCLHWLDRHESYRPGYVVHLRPTQPLRLPGQIDDVVEIILSTGCDSVKSIRVAHDHPHKMWRLDDGRLSPYESGQFRARVGPDFPRQLLPALYVSSGVVDAVRTRVLLGGSTTGSDVRAYVTDETTSVDLDTELDFMIAEKVFAIRRETQPT